jgi:lipoic acid synthetase
LNLRYVVITSVTRDDLSDGGSDYFLYATKKIKKFFPKITLELLVPDFKKNLKNFDKILYSGVDVLSHNIETVERLYPVLRPEADFNFSLEILSYSKKLNPSIKTKSGFMVGVGETKKEIFELIKILYINKVDALVIGQYFQPSKRNVPVSNFITDEEFMEYKKFAEKIGFKYVLAERFARSSSLEIVS